MGRKKDADIVIDEDSSISRYHSSIEYEKDKEGKKGRVYLSDKDSKFGTLVLLKKSVNLSGNLSGLALQFGGSIAIFQFKSNNPIGNGDGQEINESDKSTSTESVKQDKQDNLEDMSSPHRN